MIPTSDEESYKQDDEHVFYGHPSTDCRILQRAGYALCYNERTKVADWTSYQLTTNYLQTRVSRSDDFRADPEVPEGRRSELIDYRGSGFDRGHLVPAADMSRNQNTMSESFLLSNMAPQVGPGFNRGIWKHLEEKVRQWAMERKNIYVMTGPLYLDQAGSRTSDLAHLITIGPNRVAVPTHFYKIIVSVGTDLEELDAIAFILPNMRNPSNVLPSFIASIDEVETLTGLDFLKELEDVREAELESRVASSVW